MGEHEHIDKDSPERVTHIPKPRPVRPDVISRDMNVEGVPVTVGHPSLTTVSHNITRSLCYLVGKTGKGFVLLRCTPEGYLIVKETAAPPVHFGDSVIIDDVIKGVGWKVHTFKEVYNYFHMYVFGNYLEVDTSMGGNIWENRRITRGDGSSAPHVSVLELYADFRYIKIRIARGQDIASYSINVSKVE